MKDSPSLCRNPLHYFLVRGGRNVNLHKNPLVDLREENNCDFHPFYFMLLKQKKGKLIVLKNLKASGLETSSCFSTKNASKILNLL
jgi:hypothetical protein